MFSPMLDDAKVSRREAALLRFDLNLELADDGRGPESELDGKAKDAADKKGRQLQTEKVKAEISAMEWMYWYRWGTLIGCLLLAAGSLGFLHPDQPQYRRVVGSVVLVALMVVAFNSFSHVGIRFSAGSVEGG
jgi:hypothetical protein